MKINLPKTVKFIIDKIYERGYEAFIVGGCVRDCLLNIEPNDYDITTNAKPDEIVDIFRNYKIIDNGIKHGTVGVIINNEVYEITTYRIESEYEKSRRPKNVEFTTDIIKDLRRRDFTINSMAYNDRCGLIDEFDGQKDLSQKIIKTVGNPDERFTEDGLRIIRAIRFSAKLGFEIENQTMKSIYKNFKIVKAISKERITDEVNKIILSENPQKIILLFKSKIFNELNIYNNLEYKYLDDLEKQMYMLNKCKDKLEIRLLMLEYLIINKLIISERNRSIKECIKNKEINEYTIVNNLKYSKYITNYLNTTIEYMFITNYNMDKSDIKLILNKIGVEKLISIFELKQIYYNYILITSSLNGINKTTTKIEQCINMVLDIIENNECYMVNGLKINGKDLIQLGYKGTEIGEQLDFLLRHVIKNPKLNTKESLINLSM